MKRTHFQPFCFLGVIGFSVLLLVNAQTESSCKLDDVDVAYLLDVTGKPDDTPKIRHFIDRLVNDAFVIGENKTNVAIISFIPAVNALITLDRQQSNQSIRDALNKLANIEGKTLFGSETPKALSYARSTFLNPLHPKGGRNNTRKIAVIITTSIKSMLYSFCTTVDKATSAKQADIDVYVIGVGNKTKLWELQALVSEPVSSRAFAVDDFSGLYNLIANFSSALCVASHPPNKLTNTSDWYRNYKTACPDPTTTMKMSTKTSAVTRMLSITTMAADFSTDLLTKSAQNDAPTTLFTTENTSGNELGSKLKSSDPEDGVVIWASVGASSSVLLAGLIGLLVFLYLKKRRGSVQPDTLEEEESNKDGDGCEKKDTDL